MILDVRAARFAQTRARRGTDLGSGLATDIDIKIPQRQGVIRQDKVKSSLTRRALFPGGLCPRLRGLRSAQHPSESLPATYGPGAGMRVRVLPVPQCPAARQAGPGGTSSRRSGADLSASGRGGESRSPCPRHYGVERAPSQSLGIHFDSRTYWFEPRPTRGSRIERTAACSYGRSTTTVGR